MLVLSARGPIVCREQISNDSYLKTQAKNEMNARDGENGLVQCNM
jgi:hypothetical protein